MNALLTPSRPTTDDLLSVLREERENLQPAMSAAWTAHCAALGAGEPLEIERTRALYNEIEAGFNAVEAAIEKRERLISGAIGVGDRVVVSATAGAPAVGGTVVALHREFRIWWLCGRKWAEIQPRYRVETAGSIRTAWGDEIAVEWEVEG